MSLRVLFVILALSLVGLHAGWDMIRFWLVGKLHVNPCFLFLPVSIGLALGFPSARVAADYLFKLVYLFSGLILFFATALPRSLPVEPIRGFDAFWTLMVVLLIYTAFLGFLHWLLFTQPFDEWLTRGRHEPGDQPDRGTPARTRG